jgi:hypothetical protein
MITGSTFLSQCSASGVQLFANNSSATNSGSSINPYQYQGVQNAINNPNVSTSFGW